MIVRGSELARAWWIALSVLVCAASNASAVDVYVDPELGVDDAARLHTAEPFATMSVLLIGIAGSMPQLPTATKERQEAWARC